MKKQVLIAFVIGILLMNLVVVMAQEDIPFDEPAPFLADFWHTLQEMGLFAAAGQERECSINVDYWVGPSGSGADETYSGSTYYSTSTLLNSAGCSVALFNVFDRDWHFKNEYRSEDVGGFQLSSGTSTYNAIVEVYCCPYEACNSDSDCSGQYGDFCNTNYGSCYGTAPSHETDLFNCVNNNWVSSGEAEFGEERFCSDSSDNNYLDRNGGEHCRPSSYSSVNDGTWCGEICIDTSSKMCYQDKSYYIDSCGERGSLSQDCVALGMVCIGSGVCSASGGEPVCGDGIWEGDEECDDGNTVSGDGCSSNCRIELIEDCNSEGASCDGPSGTQAGQPCCSGLDCQNFQCVETGTCTSGEIKCGIVGDPYTSGDVLYECEEGTFISQGRVDGECGYITPSDAQSITWTEFYSMSDEDFVRGNYHCKQTSDCPTKEGFNVECVEEEIMIEREHKAIVDACDKNAGWLDEFGTVLTKIFPIFPVFSDGICEAVAKGIESFKELFGEEKKGFCIATSTTWYGKLWESTLKMVGGFGLPAQYVLIITIMLLITIAGMAIRMFT